MWDIIVYFIFNKVGDGTLECYNRREVQQVGVLYVIILLCVMVWTASARYNLFFFISHC